MRRPIDRLTRGRIPNKPGVVAPTVFAINNPANLANVVTGVPITISGTSPGVAAVSVTGNAVAIGSSPVVGHSWSVPWTPGALGAVALVATDGALSSNISVTVIAAVAFAFTAPPNLASLPIGVPVTVSGTSPGVASVTVTANAVSIGTVPVVGNAWSLSWTPTIAGATTLAATDGTLTANRSVTVASGVAFAFTNPANLASVTAGVPITVSGTSPGVASVSVTANGTPIGTAPVVGNAWSFSWTPTIAGVTTLAATDGTLNTNISITVTAAVAFAFTNPANLATVSAGVAITVSGTSPNSAPVTVTANAVTIGTPAVVGNAWSFSWTPTVAGATTLSATDGTLNAVISVTVSASAFAPDSISGLVLWLDPSDAASVTTTAASLASGSDFSAAAWTKGNVTVIANDTAAPDSTVTADRITVSVATAPNVVQGVSNGSTTAQKVAAVFTIYVKRNDVNWIYIETRTGSSVVADRSWFNIDLGIVGTVGANHSAVSITDVGGGWWRVNLQCNGTGTGQPELQLFLVTGDTLTTPASVGQFVWLWGASVAETRISAIVNKASAVPWTEGVINAQPGIGQINGLQAFRSFLAQTMTSTEAAVVAALANNGPFTIFAVPRPDVIAVARVFFSAANSTVQTNRTKIFTTIAGSRWRYSTTDDAAITISSDHTTLGADATPVVYECWSSGAVASIRINGDAASPAAAAHSPGTLTPDRVGILGRVDLTPDSQWLGTLGEITVYNRELNATERADLRQYLGAKWGIAVVVP